MFAGLLAMLGLLASFAGRNTSSSFSNEQDAIRDIPAGIEGSNPGLKVSDPVKAVHVDPQLPLVTQGDGDLTLYGLSQSGFTSGLFGGNILAPRGEMIGSGSYKDLVRDLNATDLRYPGGSLTEEYFDITNPNAERVTGNENGKTVDFIPLSEFMQAAAALNAPVTIVLPTRTELSDQVDSNGNRLPDIDEDALRTFVHDVATGKYGEAPVRAFEIGNEYWGSGRMSSAEYGKLSAEMSRIIKDELRIVEELAGTGDEVDVVIQMGTNFKYASLDDVYSGQDGAAIIDDVNAKYGLDLTEDSLGKAGKPNWAELSNEIIMSFFDDGNIADIDGIVAHVYSKEPAIEGQRSFHLDMIEKTWGEKFPGLDVYVSEWNTSGNTAAFEREEDYGLFQAREMLNMVEQFVESGVDVAHAWPLLQNSPNTFSVGFHHEGLTPAGEMFSMMAESLPGKTILDFSPTDETEAELGDIAVHGYYGEGDLVFFIVSTSGGTVDTDVDISNLVSGFGGISAEVLGVAPGDAPGDNDSQAYVDTLTASEAFGNGALKATLDQGEIMKVTLSDIQPTAAFSAVLEQMTIDDDLTGTASDDVLKGYDGHDTLSGGAGNDVLNGGRGDDRLEGGTGNDVLRGREDADQLFGGSGDDRLYGESGSDTIYGGSGADTLEGGWGDDVLHGGEDADLLIAGAGNNAVTGGAGNDMFAFHDDKGGFVTRIKDFIRGEDKIIIDSKHVGSFDDLLPQPLSGDEIMLLLGGDEDRKIILEGMDNADGALDAEDVLIQ